MPEATEVLRKAGRKEAASCLCSSWSRWYPPTTSEAGSKGQVLQQVWRKTHSVSLRLSPSCVSQSSFPHRALGLQGKERGCFLCTLSAKQKGSCRHSLFAPTRSEPSTKSDLLMAQTYCHRLAHPAGGNLPGLSICTGPRLFLTQWGEGASEGCDTASWAEDSETQSTLWTPHPHPPGFQSDLSIRFATVLPSRLSALLTSRDSIRHKGNGLPPIPWEASQIPTSVYHCRVVSCL